MFALDQLNNEFERVVKESKHDDDNNDGNDDVNLINSMDGITFKICCWNKETPNWFED